MVRGEGTAVARGASAQDAFDFVLDPAQYTRADTKMVWVTKLSPLNLRRYSWIPIKANAHARGELNTSTAGRASTNSWPAITWKLR